MQINYTYKCIIHSLQKILIHQKFQHRNLRYEGQKVQLSNITVL